MPSLLHILDVDKKAKYSPYTAAFDAQFGGGQNWGMVGIYTCSVSCDQSREEIAFVQHSGDGTPEKRAESAMVVEVQYDAEDEDEV